MKQVMTNKLESGIIAVEKKPVGSELEQERAELIRKAATLTKEEMYLLEKYIKEHIYGNRETMQS